VEMLISRAERQFESWTGRRPRPGVMRVAALAETDQRGAEGTEGTTKGTKVAKVTKGLDTGGRVS